MEWLALLNREELELILNYLHPTDRVAASLASRLFSELRTDRGGVCVRCAELHKCPQWPAGLCMVDLTHPRHKRRTRAVELLAAMKFDMLDPLLAAAHAGAVRSVAGTRHSMYSAVNGLLARLLFHPRPDVRLVATTAIAGMWAKDLANGSRANCSRQEMRVRHLLALRDLGTLDPLVLAQYAGTVARMLDVADRDVRRVALDTLGKLEPAAIAQCAGAVVRMIADDDWYVRRAAMWTIYKLEPMTLAHHAMGIVRQLDNSEWHVRLASVQVMGKLQPVALMKHARCIVQALDDENSEVRRAAEETLRRLGPTALVCLNR